MSKSEYNSIPKGIFSRASATGRIALRLGMTGAGRLIGRRKSSNEKLGNTLLSELDRLKGMAMKIGQILSYLDAGFPDEVTEQLAKLRTGVQPLPFEMIKEVIEAEFGRPVDDLYAEFDTKALAAASIGQVHTAVTWEGERVAVKVRYPGIEETMAADFNQLKRLGSIAGRLTAVDGKALVAELHARVAEECDYELEASWQLRFTSFFEDDDALLVPHIHKALCGHAVLTTTFHEGLSYETFLTTAPQDSKNKAAQSLLRLAFKPLFRAGMMHADPHPGNQIYYDTGQIVALDFGCVRAFDHTWVAHYRRFCIAILDDAFETFRELACELGLAPRPERIDFEELWIMYRWMYEPLWKPHFAFHRAWWLQGRRFTSPSAKNGRHQGFPPEWIWIMRLHWGLWALLVSFEAEGDFGTPFRAFLDMELPHAESIYASRI
jgi:predicted unusual protein kinase regulating ubiquinone biosynthesis (AarF/ABC1/UbiB family)